MKKTSFFSILIIFFFVLLDSASAIPLYYTFKGVVSYDTVDHSGFEAWSGIPLEEQLNLGDYVYHTVLIDYDPNIPFSWGDGWSQEFSAQYIYGNSMILPEYNLGYNSNPEAGTRFPGVLFSLPYGPSVGDSAFAIYSWDLMVYDWVVGTQVTAHSWLGIFDQQDQFLVLTSISDTLPSLHNPIPEPSTMFLLSTGLIGLAGWKRKKLKRK